MNGNIVTKATTARPKLSLRSRRTLRQTANSTHLPNTSQPSVAPPSLGGVAQEKEGVVQQELSGALDSVTNVGVARDKEGDSTEGEKTKPVIDVSCLENQSVVPEEGKSVNSIWQRDSGVCVSCKSISSHGSQSEAELQANAKSLHSSPHIDQSGTGAPVKTKHVHSSPHIDQSGTGAPVKTKHVHSSPNIDQSGTGALATSRFVPPQAQHSEMGVQENRDDDFKTSNEGGRDRTGRRKRRRQKDTTGYRVQSNEVGYEKSANALKTNKVHEQSLTCI